MLIIISESISQSEKDFYKCHLPVDDVILCGDFASAIDTVRNNNTKYCIIINHLMIDDIKYKRSELKNMKKNFVGNVILKVNQESVGLELMKEKLIDDYFLSNEDFSVQFTAFAQALQRSILKKKINKGLFEAQKTLDTLKGY